MPAYIDSTLIKQSELIDRLGGPAKVARLINEMCRTNQQSPAVSMMRIRGIPWHWRPALAHAAAIRQIPLPKGFLGYKV